MSEREKPNRWGREQRQISDERQTYRQLSSSRAHTHIHPSMMIGSRADNAIRAPLNHHRAAFVFTKKKTTTTRTLLLLFPPTLPLLPFFYRRFTNQFSENFSSPAASSHPLRNGVTSAFPHHHHIFHFSRIYLTVMTHMWMGREYKRTSHIHCIRTESICLKLASFSMRYSHSIHLILSIRSLSTA